ncbi:hypothetical protein ACFMQL_19185 [Nonomuraea fastidiosa]|uniref:hypothetical protein n=1 Tax=Nonomuraea fastidiosa TaxID=46173 RepID=UPI00366A5E3D
MGMRSMWTFLPTLETYRQSFAPVRARKLIRSADEGMHTMGRLVSSRWAAMPRSRRTTMARRRMRSSTGSHILAW